MSSKTSVDSQDEYVVFCRFFPGFTHGFPFTGVRNLTGAEVAEFVSHCLLGNGELYQSKDVPIDFLGRWENTWSPSYPICSVATEEVADWISRSLQNCIPSHALRPILGYALRTAGEWELPLKPFNVLDQTPEDKSGLRESLKAYRTFAISLIHYIEQHVGTQRHPTVDDVRPPNDLGELIKLAERAAESGMLDVDFGVANTAATQVVTTSSNIAADHEDIEPSDVPPSTNPHPVSVAKSQPEPDGPCGLYEWRHNNSVLEMRLTPKPWELGRVLYSRIGRKVSFEELCEPPLSIYNEEIDPNGIARSARTLNKYCKDNELRYVVQSSAKQRIVIMRHNPAS